MFAILALLVFVAIVMVGSALATMVRTRDEADHALAQRLTMAAGASVQKEAPALLKDQRLSRIGVLDSLLSRVSFVRSVERTIRQAGLKRRAGEILLYMPLLACVGFLFALVVNGSPILALVVGGFAGTVPLLLIQRRKRIRTLRFAEQLPDALDLIRAALQAGHGFATALMVVATEFPDPIAEEFREVSDETRLGLSLREALTNLTDRIDDPDLPMLVIGVLITDDSGGNLAEVLDNIGHTVRERFKMSRDVRVMTAQGRLSGMVLTALPFIVGTAMFFLNPTYFRPMLSNPIGQQMLAYAFVSILLGHFLIQRIARLQA